MSWEVTAGLAIIIMALVFLPRYLTGSFSTLPQFLEYRFDAGVRRLSAVLLLLGYGLITIPSVLYPGSLAALKLFNLPEVLQISDKAGLLLTILTVGAIGGIHAVFGGSRAVTVSDTLNDVGLLIVGATVPTLALIALGDGSLIQGFTTLTESAPEKLNAVGGDNDPVPFGTIFTGMFTGMILANLFYWGTNQHVIQPTLSAKNLAEGQKGILLAGFFLAVLLSTVFSSLNSLLNSAATLFCLDLYQPLCSNKLSDQQLITTAKIANLVIALQFVFDTSIHFIHVYATLFVIEVGIMLAFAMVVPETPKPGLDKVNASADLAPWRYAYPVPALLLLGMVGTYLLFSEIGLASDL